MQNRAYRFGCNSDRNKHRQRFNFQRRRLDIGNDCCQSGDRQSNHRRFDSRNKFQSHHQFNGRRNSPCCTQPFRNRRGW